MGYVIKTVVLLLIFSSSLSMACNEEQYLKPPEKCIGRETEFIRTFHDVTHDLPSHIVSSTENLITFSVSGEETIDCLEPLRADLYKRYKAYAFKKTKYRSCHITNVAVCSLSINHSSSTKKGLWDCSREMELCSNRNPSVFKIVPQKFSQFDEEMLKKLNPQMPFVEREEVLFFSIKEKEKTLKFKVRWRKNDKFLKECENKSQWRYSF